MRNSLRAVFTVGVLGAATVSIGCLALGDPGIEELYVLLADVGLSRTRERSCVRSEVRAESQNRAR